MKQKRIFIDLDRCIGCGSHQAACSIHHLGDDNLMEAVIPQVAEIPMHCRHCDEPLCKLACPKDAITKDENGLVKIAKMRCIGCKSCVIACPFGAITYVTKHSIINKCNLCEQERLDNNEVPCCVATCPTGAIRFIDMETEVSSLTLIGAREIGKNPFFRRSC